MYANVILSLEHFGLCPHLCLLNVDVIGLTINHNACVFVGCWHSRGLSFLYIPLVWSQEMGSSFKKNIFDVIQLGDKVHQRLTKRRGDFS